MKKFLVISLAAAILVTGLTACGSKSKTVNYDNTSRVLYTDEDTESSSEADDSESESESESESNEETDTAKDASSKASSKDEKKSSDSDKKKDSSSKAASSKTTASKAESSKAASSKTTSSRTPSTYISSRPTSTTSSKASESSSSASTSSKAADTDTSTDTDTATNTDTDTVTDTDTLIDTGTDSATDTDDTDSEIVGSAPFSESEDLIFTYNGTLVTLGGDMSDVLKGLTPDVTSDPEPMGNGKNTVTYYYNQYGFEIMAYTDDSEPDEDSVYKVYKIRMDTAGYSAGTEKMIGIGDSKDDMLSIYGSGYELENGVNYVYYSSDRTRHLTFTVVDDYISEIVISTDI